MTSHILILLVSFINLFSQSTTSSLSQGAWKSDEGIIIFSGNYFAFTAYNNTAFGYTYGGSWKMDDQTMVLTYEFNTQTPKKVGTSEDRKIVIHDKSMVFGNIEFKQVDEGTPGKLSGAWLFSNRKRDGEIGNPRSADNPRKTMKILSGTRFQWIAYNVDTKEFMGTGGGTYTTVDGKYTENIDFFSRDNSRVGASLEFEYELKTNDWHHSGFSSKGDPIYEIWSLRE